MKHILEFLSGDLIGSRHGAPLAQAAATAIEEGEDGGFEGGRNREEERKQGTGAHTNTNDKVKMNKRTKNLFPGVSGDEHFLEFAQFEQIRR